MPSKKRNGSPADSPAVKNSKAMNKDKTIESFNAEPVEGYESPPDYFSGMSPQMAIEAAIGRWRPGHAVASASSTTEPTPKPEAKTELEPLQEQVDDEDEDEEEEEEGEEEESAYEPQTCHWGTCRQTFTGEDGPVDLVNHLSEDHVGRDDDYNPQCGWGSCTHLPKKRRDDLISHVNRHVPVYKPTKCPQCEYVCQEWRELRRHLKRLDHQ